MRQKLSDLSGKKCGTCGDETRAPSGICSKCLFGKRRESVQSRNHAIKYGAQEWYSSTIVQ